ncbi:hypothetical protein B0H10DRAFT_2239444 [Mycena sp. CBHHK59/15]|nr:hypothetical protein B0H10DRAFT_2239444 [Mycena sp. CBHHK59/15]
MAQQSSAANYEYHDQHHASATVHCVLPVRPASHSVAHGLLSLPCSDGSSRSMNVQLAVTASLRSDLVLGRDWMSYCRDAFPNARFLLHSASIHIHPFPIPSSAPVPNSYESAMEVDPPNDPPFTCVCEDPYAPRCPGYETSCGL